MKICLFVQTSSQEVYSVDTKILLDYYQKIIDKNHLDVRVLSFQGNNDLTSYAYFDKNRFFLPADERDTSMVMFELFRNLEFSFSDYDVIIKTNCSTVLNLSKVCEFCNSERFRKDIFYCASNVYTRIYVKKDLNVPESPENTLEVNSYPNGNLYIFSKEILHVISNEFFDMHNVIFDEYGANIDSSSAPPQMWYGVAEDLVIGCILKRNDISCVELEFIRTYPYVFKDSNIYEKNPYTAYGISCKIDYDWEIRKCYEANLLKTVCSFYLNK